jgi:hypothetical protein
MYNQKKVFKLAAIRDVVGMSVADLPGCTCSDLGSSFEAPAEVRTGLLLS